MSWEITLGIGVPVATGVILLVNKLGNIDAKLEFLQKTVEGVIGRMDRYEERHQKSLRKKHR
jgi:hypothetical protein